MNANDFSIVAASLQTNPNFPAIEATGIHRDGNMLVLTLSHNAKPHPMQENGMPIWAVVSSVVDGDTMKVAQMLERSQTIKRGAGNRQNVVDGADVRVVQRGAPR